MREALADRLEAARTLSIPEPTGQEDPSTLTGPILSGWLADVHEALGRLLVSGLSHPEPELGPGFGLLADRAAELGSVTATRFLRVLALWTDALQPGPPTRAAREELARGLWADVQGFHRWLAAFERDLALSTAAAVSAGVASPRERSDVPRFSGRVHVDGLELDRDRLLLHGHTASDRVLLVDRLAVLDQPFERPVLSRLFQEEVPLQRFGAAVVDVEAHPFRKRAGVVVLEPDFRSVPRLREGENDGRDGGVERLELELRTTPDGCELLGPGAEPVATGAAFEANARVRLAELAQPRHRFTGVVLRHRDRVQLVGALEVSGRSFPHVDPGAWAVDAGALLGWTVEASPALQAAAQLFVSGVVPRVAEIFREPVQDWSLAWCGARLEARPVADPRDDDPGGVWLSCWGNRPDHALWTVYEHLPEATLAEAAARSLLLVRRDREAARVYLQAHLDRVRRLEVLPESSTLLLLADAWAVVDQADRDGPVLDALGLDVRSLRERLGAQLLRWRRHGVEGELSSTLALLSATSARVPIRRA